MSRMVEASERQARALGELAEVARDALQRERELEERYHRAALRHPLRRMFGGEQGAVALIRSIPGFAGLWTYSVPASQLEVVRARDGGTWVLVSCGCGARPILAVGALADCGCGRWYLHAGKTIRVKNFGEALPEPAA